VRACFEAGGHDVAGAESGCEFLVGIRGRLFNVGSDYCVLEPETGYAACCSAENFAMGALAATEDAAPLERIALALSAAERHCAEVMRPFTILSTHSLRAVA